MKLLMSLASSLALCAIASPQSPAAAADKQPVVVVRGPTIVAFFPPVTKEDLKKQPDTNESLADFQLYASQLRGPLKKAGIEFHELYVRSFLLRLDHRLVTFRPVKVEVGYYMLAPGKKPRIIYGVMTDTEILQAANEYFGTSARVR